MRVEMMGNIFSAGKTVGPFFMVNRRDLGSPYTVRVISHLTGEQLAYSENGFATLGEAVEWAYDHKDW